MAASAAAGVVGVLAQQSAPTSTHTSPSGVSCAATSIAKGRKHVLRGGPAGSATPNFDARADGLFDEHLVDLVTLDAKEHVAAVVVDAIRREHHEVDAATTMSSPVTTGALSSTRSATRHALGVEMNAPLPSTTSVAPATRGPGSTMNATLPRNDGRAATSSCSRWPSTTRAKVASSLAMNTGRAFVGKTTSPDGIVNGAAARAWAGSAATRTASGRMRTGRA